MSKTDQLCKRSRSHAVSNLHYNVQCALEVPTAYGAYNRGCCIACYIRSGIVP